MSTPIPVTLSYDPDYFDTIPPISLVRTVVADCQALCLPIPARNTICQRQGTSLVDILLRCNRTAINRVNQIFDGDSWYHDRLKESRILEIVPGGQMPPTAVCASSPQFSGDKHSRGAPVSGVKRAAISQRSDMPHKRMRLLPRTPLPKKAPPRFHTNAASLALPYASALAPPPAPQQTPWPGFQVNAATPIPTQVAPLASPPASMTRRLTDAEMRGAIAKIWRQDDIVVATAPSPELPKNLQHLQCPGNEKVDDIRHRDSVAGPRGNLQDREVLSAGIRSGSTSGTGPQRRKTTAANQSSTSTQQQASNIPTTNTTMNIKPLDRSDSIRTATQTYDRTAPSTTLKHLSPPTRPKSSPARHGSKSPALTNEETKWIENTTSEAPLSVLGNGAKGGSVPPSVSPTHHGTVSATMATSSGQPTSISAPVKQIASSSVPRVISHLSVDALSMPHQTRPSRSSLTKSPSDESTRASIPDDHKFNCEPRYGTPANGNPPLPPMLSLPQSSVSPPSLIHQNSARSGPTTPVRKRSPKASMTLDPRPHNSARPPVVSPLQSSQRSKCNNANADVTIPADLTKPADATKHASVPLQSSASSRMTAGSSTSVAVSVHSGSNNAKIDLRKPKVHAGDYERLDVISSSPASCTSSTTNSHRPGKVYQSTAIVTCAAKSGTIEAEMTRDAPHDMAFTSIEPNLSAVGPPGPRFEHGGVGHSQHVVPQTTSALVTSSPVPPIIPSRSDIQACLHLRDEPPAPAPISKTPPSAHEHVLLPSHQLASSVYSPLSCATPIRGEAVVPEPPTLEEGNANTALKAPLRPCPTMRKEQKRISLESLAEHGLRLLEEGKSRQEDISFSKKTGMLKERILRINTEPDTVIAADERHKTAEERKAGHRYVQVEKQLTGDCMTVVSNMIDASVADAGVVHVFPGLSALQSDPEQAANQQLASCTSEEGALQHTLDAMVTACLQTRCNPEAQNQMHKADPSIYPGNHTALRLELNKERNISAALQRELNAQRSKLAATEQEMQAVRRECKEPFVVPVLLDLFLRLHRVPYITVDGCLGE